MQTRLAFWAMLWATNIYHGADMYMSARAIDLYRSHWKIVNKGVSRAGQGQIRLRWFTATSAVCEYGHLLRDNQSESDRTIALQVLDAGGSLSLAAEGGTSRSVTKVAELPSTPFVVTAVSLMRADRDRRSPLVTARTALVITALNGLKHLESLIIDSPIVPTEAIKRINIPSLRSLVLAVDSLRNGELAFLATLSNLESLSIHRAPVDDDCLHYVSQVNTLKTIALRYTAIEGSGLEAAKKLKLETQHVWHEICASQLGILVLSPENCHGGRLHAGEVL